MTIPNKDLDDLILLRSDGTPTYMLAVVVDDHDMGVTHIIRGVDHLTNAARQIQIYKACGWDVPVMAHIPLIHGADGAKLSKRHGALGVDAYRAMGYLPAALRNYLVRLGWSHGDQEVFSTEEMITEFALEHVGKSAARFDFAKLENLNGVYIRQTADEELLAAVKALLPYLDGDKGFPSELDEVMEQKLLMAMPGLKERAKTLLEIIDGAKFIFAQRPLALDEKANALLSPQARTLLSGVHSRLEALPAWDMAEAEAAVRAEAEASGVKLGAVAQPLRAALTGRSTSPGIFDVLNVLGREESLARIKAQAAA